MSLRLLLSTALLLALPLPASAQFGFGKDDPAKPAPGSKPGVTTPGAGASGTGGAKLGKEVTVRWKVGMIVTSIGGNCVGLYGTVPVPTEWPEQDVKIFEEEVSKSVSNVKYRTLNGGVKQMLVTIPRLNAGEQAKVLVTFEMKRRLLEMPENPASYVQAATDKLPPEVKRYLLPSPYIESTNPKIKALAKEVTEGKTGAWEKVESIYDWTIKNLKYKNGKVKGAMAALKDRDGDCEEFSALFIAMCRSLNIPARTIWVPDHCYSEFYLADASGKGHWFPCQSAGDRCFGQMPDPRPILQKGDDFNVPEKQGKQRYVAEFLKVNTVGGGGKPEVLFIRQPVPVDVPKP